MIARAESLRRAMVVANYIEPVRLLVNELIAIEERHFNPIVWQSVFVPQLQAPLYALGFARFFQGDLASAAHLVIPQLEPSLRHILKAHGADPTKRRDDATEEDRRAPLDPSGERRLRLSHLNQLSPMAASGKGIGLGRRIRLASVGRRPPGCSSIALHLSDSPNAAHCQLL
jgi:hypothetical protein